MKRKKTFSKKLAEDLLKKQNNKCNACGCKIGTSDSMVGYEFDHIIPFSFLDNNPDDNWQLLCPRCNYIAGNKVFHSSDIEMAKFLKNQYILEKRLKKSI